MAFTGKEGEQVSLTDAARWTANYRSANPNATKAAFAGKNILNSILAQTGCMGVRMYRGIDDNGVDCVVLVGCDSNGRDMTSGILAERLPLCPPICDDTSSLNG